MKKTPHLNSKILKKNLKCKRNISYFLSSSRLFLLKNKTKNGSSSSRQEEALARRAQPRTLRPISPPAPLATARGSPRFVPVCVMLSGGSDAEVRVSPRGPAGCPWVIVTGMAV